MSTGVLADLKAGNLTPIKSSTLGATKSKEKSQNLSRIEEK